MCLSNVLAAARRTRSSESLNHRILSKCGSAGSVLPPTPSHGNWPQINFLSFFLNSATTKFKYHENKTSSNHRFLSPTDCSIIPSDSWAKCRDHPNELIPGPLSAPPPTPTGQPLPIELLAEECGQFLQVRETAGARLHKIRVQGELSA